MKKTLLLTFICIVVFAFPVSAAENFTKGFRGIPWGTPAPRDNNSCNNKWKLYGVGKPLSEKRYERAGEDLYFAGAKVLFIEYIFQDSLGFAKVEIAFRGIENYKLLRRVCFENWGQPVDGHIDENYLGPDELKKEKRDLKNFNYKSKYSNWKGSGIEISLEHNNCGKNEGTMFICLKDYHTIFERDNANNYAEEIEELNAFLEEWGLR